MNLKSVTLDHGETYGQLKVLERMESGRYRVGCVCGFSKDSYRAKSLMRADGPRKCRRCRKAENLSCKDRSGEMNNGATSKVDGGTRHG